VQLFWAEFIVIDWIIRQLLNVNANDVIIYVVGIVIDDKE
jgi:hypothetical protein